MRTDGTFHLLSPDTVKLLSNRGPDWQSNITYTDHQSFHLNFYGTVLSIVGDGITKQPLEDDNGVFCFNGEIYHGLQINCTSTSDTEALHRHLSSISSTEEYVSLFSSLRGPWALIYLDKKTNIVYFGRDIFGRRCLLIRKTPVGFLLSSVAHPEDSSEIWEEIPARGVYTYDINQNEFGVFEWQQSVTGKSLTHVSVSETLSVITVHSTKLPCPIDKCLSDDFTYHLPPPSEGSLHLQYDRLCQELSEFLSDFKNVLSESVKKRIEFSKSSIREEPVGILFSGGIDSVMLTALAIENVQKRPLHLLNVSFEHKDSKGQPTYDSPDRQTAIDAFLELKSIYPESVIQLICIDVPYNEVIKARENKHISRLVYPMNTVLDDSLGFALWFAARGKGYCYMSRDDCISNTKILLLGMGADDQLGGYSRHAASFKGGWESLHAQISEEVDRISWRNLGRDDRVIADLGKESRLPFLDEDVVSYLNSVPLPLKAQLQHPRGIGDKLLLRLLAHSMGLNRTSTRAKRAIQFGSRIAHADPKKTKGHLACDRLA